MSDKTPVRLYFESGATHDMDHTTRFPVVGLDPEGRVIVDITSELGTKDGQPYLFGLTLCCDAFDKGMEDGVGCRSCYGLPGETTERDGRVIECDAGANWPEVADPFAGSTPWLPVPGHFNDVTGNFCTREGSLALAGRCPDGCDHAPHYTNDGHPECKDDEFMKRLAR